MQFETPQVGRANFLCLENFVEHAFGAFAPSRPRNFPDIKNMQGNPLDLKELQALMTGFWLTDLANFSAYVYQNLPDINWVGFYLSDGKKLRLGPFMGKPACTEIKFGKGVCGTSFSTEKSMLVDDVDTFPGHIRCDSASRSEIVIPLYVNKKLVGVLDVDSPTHSRFSKDDLVLMENSLAILSKQLQAFPNLEAL